MCEGNANGTVVVVHGGWQRTARTTQCCSPPNTAAAAMDWDNLFDFSSEKEADTIKKHQKVRACTHRLPWI